MKKQIIFIKWWEAKENFENYLDYIKKMDFDPYEEKQKKWSDFFQENLWENFEVLTIPMPNKGFADYDSWKIMFEKIFSYLKKDYFLVWHSLWATFLIKYLSENKIEKSPKNIFLLAPAFEDDEKEKIWTFNFSDLKSFEKYQEKSYFLHSKDDFVVDFWDFLKFKNIFKNANFIEFENKNHFLDKNFDEFLDLLRKKSENF